MEKRIDEQGVSTQTVVIEDDVWVGANSVILPGVTLGKHCVVAAGSIVTHSVPPYSICAGCPAKVIKSYDFETNEWQKVAEITINLKTVKKIRLLLKRIDSLVGYMIKRRILASIMYLGVAVIVAAIVVLIGKF